MSDELNGPWTQSFRGNVVLHGQTTRGYTIRNKEGEGIAHVYDGPEVKSNVSVMVCAPTMLETLRWVVNQDWNDGPGSWVHLERRLEEVIAMAEEEPQVIRRCDMVGCSRPALETTTQIAPATNVRVCSECAETV